MGTGDPTVDVLIVTCGDYSGLSRTIDSVLEQNYPIHSVILTDDGSKKPFPPQLILRLQKTSAQLTIRNWEENAGTVAHMNKAARLSDGDHLKFMAAGDAFSDSGALGALISFAKQTDMPAVTSSCMVCSSDLKRKYYRFPGARRGKWLEASGHALFSVLARGNVISAAGTLFRRDFFQKLGGFDESYRLLEDWPTWLRLVRDGYSIPYLPRVTALYAMGGISSANGSALCAPLLQKDMLHCYEKEILPYPEMLSPSVNRTVCYCCDKLRGMPPNALMKRYFLLAVKDAAKRGIKTCMMKIRR